VATEGTSQPTPELIAEIKALVARAKAGDETAVPQLRGYLDRHPELWQKYGDAAAQTERAWITLAAGTNLHLRECMIRFAEAQRAELTRPSASPAERMLVDRVVACGLQLEYFSAIEANAVEAKNPPKLHQWWAKRHTQAQRAFQAAMASLLTVQKLFPAMLERAVQPVTAVEPEAVSVPIPETGPATVPAAVEQRPELPRLRPTDWTEWPEEPVSTPNLLKVRT
jgi:hypothetical protein